MNGFLVFITMVVSLASWGGYSFPLPNIYPAGREMVITADRYCDCRSVEPVEDVEYTTRKIDNYRIGITFLEPGEISGLVTFCFHSIYQDAPVIVPVDWLIR